MKKPLFKVYSEHLMSALKSLLLRFPMQLVIIALMASLFFVLNHISYDSQLETSLVKWILSCVVTFFLGLGFVLSSESQSLNHIKSIWLQIVALICWWLFYYLLSDLWSVSDVAMAISTIAGVLAYVFFAPYLTKSTEKEQYYWYFYNTTIAFVFAFIVGALLLILWMIALWSIDLLFDVFQQWNIYGDWAIIALSLFAPLFGLSYIPTKASFTSKSYNITAFIEFIIKYIGISFVCIYFIILYAYSIKVLMNFNEWPQWEVSWLVIGFSIGWYLVYLYSSALEQENVLIATFRKALPYVIFPQLFMLFYAIYLRINQYWLTINRYLVVIFWVFLVIVSLYYIFSKTKSLKTLPMVLAVTIALMSVWPWSIYSLPVADQLDRLETKLIDASILQDWIIVPVPKDATISQTAQDDIIDTIRYLCDYHRCEAMNNLFPTIDYSIIDRYNVQQKIEELLNISYAGGLYYAERYSLQWKELLSSLPLDVRWFSTIISVSSTPYWTWLQAVIDGKNKKLVLMSSNNELENIDISDVFEQLLALDAQPRMWREYDKELQFEIKPSWHRLVISYISFAKKIENDTVTIDPSDWLQINGYLLMK